MIPVVASNVPWRAAVAVDGGLWAFDPAGWLEETVGASGGTRAFDVSATVEVRRAAGGIAPSALLGGSFEPKDGTSLSLRVAWSGALATDNADAQKGLLGHALVKGLADEFASAVLRGLSSQPELNEPGVLTVQEGAYDPVESSGYAFERAAALLKWVLLVHGSKGPSAAELAMYLGQWGST